MVNLSPLPGMGNYAYPKGPGVLWYEERGRMVSEYCIDMLTRKARVCYGTQSGVEFSSVAHERACKILQVRVSVAPEREMRSDWVEFLQENSWYIC
jgi:hypothetical protein